MSNNADPRTMMSVSFVQTLLAVAKNCDTAPAALEIDLSFGASVVDEAIKCIGYALRGNTRVQYLTVRLGEGAPIQEETMKGILYFVANNPSLKVLQVKALGNYEAVPYLLKASATNASILKLDICSNDTAPASELGDLLKCNGSLKELRLSQSDRRDRMCYEGLGQSLMENTTLETLNFGCPDYGGWQSRILSTLSKSPTNLKNLGVHDWCAALPFFLFSPHTAIQKLHIYDVDLSSRFDLLLLALMGSGTTTSLVLESCSVDVPSIEKFITALQDGQLAIRHLNFIDAPFMFEGEHVQGLLDSGVLETLGLVGEHEDDILRANAECLKCTTLSTLKMSMGSLEGMSPALMAPMTLQSLDLTLYQPCVEDVSLLVNMICTDNDEHQLQKLTLRESFFNETQLGTVIKALEGSRKLHTFRLVIDDSEGEYTNICGMLGESLEKNVSLRVLEVESFTELERLDDLVFGVSKNKSLEKVNVTHTDTKRPFGTTGQHSKLEFFMQRNKLKKLVRVQSQHNTLSLGEWVDKLATFPSFWEGLSLTFWLLKEEPALFFSGFGGDDSRLNN